MSGVAVFGGSFNPPHLGHQTLCLMLLEVCDLEKVLLIPTYKHVFGKNLEAFEHRFAMCEHIAKPFAGRVIVDPIESTLGNTQSRMLETLEALETRDNRTGFRLVIGADILLETDKWYQWERVKKIARPLVFERYGYKGGELPSPPDVSSTKIRERLKCGLSALPWIPLSVQHYIDEHRLYQ